MTQQPFHDLDQITVRQRITMMVNRYDVRAGGADGPLLAMAQQKRMALREQVTSLPTRVATSPCSGSRHARSWT